MTDILYNSSHQQGYFSLNHCIYSPIAQLNEIDNVPGSDYFDYKDIKLKKDKIILNLHNLFRYCINPLYRKYGGNLGLTSVYRNMEVNQLLGGVMNSQHCYGYAADIVLRNGVESLTLFNWCRANIPKYNQLILEYPEKGSYSTAAPDKEFSWVHISYIEGNKYNKNSISSKDPQTHTRYKNTETYHIGNFTHNIPHIDRFDFEFNSQY